MINDKSGAASGQHSAISDQPTRGFASRPFTRGLGQYAVLAGHAPASSWRQVAAHVREICASRGGEGAYPRITPINADWSMPHNTVSRQAPDSRVATASPRHGGKTLGRQRRKGIRGGECQSGLMFVPGSGLRTAASGYDVSGRLTGRDVRTCWRWAGCGAGPAAHKWTCVDNWTCPV